MKRSYSITETASELSCGRTKVFSLIKEKKLKALRLDGKLVVLDSEIDRFLESLPEAA